MIQTDYEVEFSEQILHPIDQAVVDSGVEIRDLWDYYIMQFENIKQYETQEENPMAAVG